jgi:UDP-N-acetylmuramoyl-tripeptide--D-alanyl-D-alanine ligase
MKSFLKKLVQLYLKLLTKFVLWRHKPYIIAVSGSTNKTTVKDYILKFLREKYPPTGEAGGERVRGNPKSYNTEIGLPLAILYLDSGESSPLKWAKILLQATARALFSAKFPKKLVLELGVEGKGDMRPLLEMVRPNVAIITNIQGSYTYSNSGLEQISEEMKLLIESIPKNGYVLLNGDDAWVKELAKYSKAKAIVYGIADDADARAENLRTDAEGQSFDFEFDGRKETVRIKKYGRHFVSAWIAAKVTKNIV